MRPTALLLLLSLGLLLSSCEFLLPTPQGMEGESECAVLLSQVGQEAALLSRSHGVQGTATVVDGCTIVLEHFHFDGKGVDVRAVVDDNPAFAAYVALSGDLRRDTPYVDERLELPLPEGLTPEKVKYFSIWCVPVGVSFGDAAFVAPGGV